MRPKQRKVVKYDRESHLLIIDDDETLLKFFKIHLNRYFSRVTVVATPKDGIKIIKNKDVDIVLADIVMPKMNGFEFTEKAKKIDITIPVLLISGAELDDDEEEALTEADGYLSKPFDVDELHDFIMSGIKKRKALVDLADIAKDSKLVRRILNQQVKIEDAVEASELSSARKLINQIAA